MRFPFNKPVPRISSPYGWRFHPIEKIRKHHNGVDYAGALGTNVYAIHNGKVLFAGPSRLKFSNGEPAGGGFIIKIRHKVNGKFITSSYMHLLKGSLKVKKGDRVKEGQIIAKLGNTGASTGPHLHFEIQRGRTYVWTSNGSRYEEPISFINTQIELDRKKKRK
jgi:murein DD-endopeptidase MepM/ murein hydrolase activator NlpD